MTRSKRVYLVVGILVLVSAIPTFLTVRFLIIAQRESNSERIPVLMYHRVLPEAGSENRYELSIEKFENQLAFLSQAGYRSLSLDDLLKSYVDSIREPKQPIILTFDDGTIDHHQYVFPLLKEYGFTATFFVVTEWIDHRGVLSEGNIVEMKSEGMSFGSHTHTHPFLDQLDSTALLYELRESKKILEEILNEPVDLLAITGGWYNGDVLKSAEDVGYRLICTSDVGTTSLKKVSLLVKRIDVPDNLNLSDFIDLWSPSAIAWKDTKRQIKIVIHKFLGSSKYAALGRMSSIYFLLIPCGAMGFVIIMIIYYIRNREKSHQRI